LNNALSLLSRTRLGFIVFVLFGTLLLSAQESPQIKTIEGSGSSFASPIIGYWAMQYRSNGAELHYQRRDNEEAVRQLQAGFVDFAVVDIALTQVQLDNSTKPLIALPVAVGAIVPVYNVPGVGEELAITPEILSGILRGTITRWNDAAIVALNPGITLPNIAITPVIRSDENVETYVLTDYLAKADATWRDTKGRTTKIEGTSAQAADSAQRLVDVVNATPGAIGYVNLTAARQLQLHPGQLKNAAAIKVKAHSRAMSSAAASAEKPDHSGFQDSITNSTAPDSYPISSFVWIVVPRDLSSATNGAALKAFVSWILTEGQLKTKDVGFAPVPDEPLQHVRAQLDSLQ
jgi:phosphate transport system substrate-binding protein